MTSALTTPASSAPGDIFATTHCAVVLAAGKERVGNFFQIVCGISTAAGVLWLNK